MKNKNIPIIEKLSQLTQEQRQLLKQALLNQHSGKQKTRNLTIQPLTTSKIKQKSSLIEYAKQRHQTKNLPLSFSQERLWFFDQFNPNSCAYNINRTVKLTGNLNINALEKSLQTVIQRHETLRTIFFQHKNGIFQKVLSNPQFKLVINNLHTIIKNNQQEKLNALIYQELRKPFNLSNDLMLRANVYYLGEKHYIFNIILHHIAGDGWSLGVLTEEINQLYNAYINNQPSPLPELPLQYADFSLWQKNWYQGINLKSQLSYWRDKFKGELPVLNFPTDYPRPPIETFKGSIYPFNISSEFVSKLKQLSEQLNVTLYMVLLTVLNILLFRFTGDEDIIIGTPIASRNYLEIEELIGFFVNTLALRTDLSGNPTFEELVQRVTKTSQEAYAHQDLSYEKLIQELKIERDLSRSSLTQIIFAFQNTPKTSLNLSGLEVSSYGINKSDNPSNISLSSYNNSLDNGTARGDLSFLLKEEDVGIGGFIEYNTDLFNRDTISRLSKHFLTLLAGIVDNPKENISYLPLLSAVKQQQMLEAWNNTEAYYPKDKCFHQLFEEQVVETPNAIAVVFEKQKLTYRELNYKSNQVAHYLQQKGVAPEILVGICVERSLEMLISILGILKAGGAYLPLDPEYPVERLAYMLEDSSVPILLTTESLLLSLPKHKGEIICLDKESDVIAKQSKKNPISRSSAENLAYIIYTSGSTGKPKGTMIVHQGLSNYLSWFKKTIFVKEGDGTLVHSSICFDATIDSLFTPLIVGQKVTLLPDKNEIEALVTALVDQSNYSILNATPSLLEIVKHLLPASISTIQLNVLIIGGEAFTDKSLSFWRTNAPETRIINLYGPTEAVVATCFNEVETSNSLTDIVPIGRPITNRQLYILDRYLKPVPIGVIAELYIGGVGLARGYLNRPDLTAEKFINNPFGEGKLYKTGDLARYLPDGNIVFIGRIDHQIKIRGFRIELGEVESVLNHHSNIKESVVISRENRQKNKYLVAYLVAIKKLEITELKNFLAKKLPEYMIPSAFVFLESFTLTPNGKIDHKALPEPDLEILREDKFIAPRNHIETKLAVIWQEVLDVAKIGINDNFFVMGGHSLLATQVISRIRDKFNQELPLRHLFESPTIKELAKYFATSTLAVNSNDEIVQQNLPLPNLHSPDSKKSLIASYTQLETQLVSIWSDVLGLEFIDMNSIIYQLSEDPILSSQIVNHLQDRFDVELPTAKLFLNTSIAKQAKCIEREVTSRMSGASSRPSIQSVVRDDKLELSFAQERLWLVEQIAPDNSAYNIVMAIKIIGVLDRIILKKSLNEIISRHESLRTSFPIVNGKTFQQIASQLEIEIPVYDLHRNDETGLKEEIKRYVLKEKTYSFDLASGPVIRAVLLYKGKDEHVLLLTIHHIASDGWSLGVLFSELGTLYKAYSQGLQSPLTALPIQYADFAVWQRQWLTGVVLENNLDYWRENLADLPTLNLPTDRLRPSIQTYNGSQVILQLPDELCTDLQNLSQTEGATLYMTMLATFAVLLHRYSGQDDVVVGSPIANRNQSEIEGLIGFFVNSLVMRTDLSGEPDFRELLSRVRNSALEAFAHQNLPFEKLVEELNPERDLSLNPIFQVSFALQNIPGIELDLVDLNLSTMHIETLKTHFDLDVYILEEATGLVIKFIYNTDLFDESTITRMLEHYRCLLNGVVSNPSCRISELPLLTNKEEQKLLIEWNNTTIDYPEDIYIHDLFEQQVKRTPNAVAIICEEKEITYQELNQSANQLAHYLTRLGVQPGIMVGIFTERSIKTIIGLLGILKVGGVYVPLDPDYPRERLAYMLDDARLSFLLTTNSGLDTFSEKELNIVCLDTDWAIISQESKENPDYHTTTDTPACIIYTSGSTGNPKGVIVQHGNIINLIHWLNETYPNRKGDVYCQKTSLSFIDSVWEIFGPLSMGLRLAIIPERVVKDLPLFVEMLAEYQVARIILVPSLLRALLNTYPNLQCELPKLKEWISSGEALSTELAQQFWQQCPKYRLINLYGSSEVMAVVTSYDVIQSDRVVTNIPIGKPIGNTQIFILDPNMQPVPIGVVGELHVGGAGLAKGYLNRTKLTAEKFVSNPFNNEPGSHLYKTGDLAHYLQNGDIQYDGRIDQQIKLRGFRIELGEIEGLLSLNSQLQEVVIVDKEDPIRDKYLAAYYVVKGKQLVSPEDLRTFLMEKLPHYMVPSTFVCLEKIPLTANNKVDRNALMSHDDFHQNETENKHSNSPAEQVMISIWKEVLGLEKIRIDDNFFHLGGHSLLAVRLFSIIFKAFDVELPIASLFQHPTVKTLSKVIDNLDGKSNINIDGPWDTSVIMNQGPEHSDKTIFIVGGVGGNVNNLYELSVYLGNKYKVIGLQTRGVLKHKPYNTIEEMAIDHVQYIKRHQQHGPYTIIGYSGGADVAQEIVSNLERLADEVKLLGILDKKAPTFNFQPSFIALLKAKVKWHISKGLKFCFKVLINKFQFSFKPAVIKQSEAIQHLEYLKEHQKRTLKRYKGNSLYCDIKLFLCPPTNSRQVLERKFDETFGWNSTTNGDVEVISVEYNHIDMLEGDNAFQLSKQIIKSIK